MTSYPDLMDDDLPDPGAMLADRGYDSDGIRNDLERCGVDPVIPTEANRKIQHVICQKTYAMRNRIDGEVWSSQPLFRAMRRHRDG